MVRMGEVTKGLEVSLGPDTGDLSLRIGINSGPVTAGVLQGEKSRFQLFGDTVNTASRMESTGEVNRIHVSASTANLLKEAGKAYWVKARDDLVHAKGKGKIQTFWVVSGRTGPILDTDNNTDNLRIPGGGPRRGAPPRTRSMLASAGPTRGVQRATSDTVTKAMVISSQSSEAAEKREERLIEWHLDMFVRLLKKIVAVRLETQVAEKEGRVAIESGGDVNEGIDARVVLLNDAEENELKKFQKGREGNPSYSRKGGMRLKKEASFKAPRRRPSIGLSTHSMLSLDTNDVSLLGSSVGDFSFSSLHDEGSASRLDCSKSTSFPPDDTKIVVDEVAEVIALPQFAPEATKSLANADNIELSETVVSQLKEYIAMIAHSYRNNHFHNFEVSAFGQLLQILSNDYYLTNIPASYRPLAFLHSSLRISACCM
jgi:Adenylate and Guanylate cyclase catalytic domain